LIFALVGSLVCLFSPLVVAVIVVWLWRLVCIFGTISADRFDTVMRAEKTQMDMIIPK